MFEMLFVSTAQYTIRFEPPSWAPDQMTMQLSLPERAHEGRKPKSLPRSI